MNNKEISDIPSLRKLKNDIDLFKSMKERWPFIKPILEFLKVDTDLIEKKLNEVPELVKNSEELLSIPAKFNDLFSSRGWIIYDLMNLETVKQSILLGEIGDFERAELVLVDYYSPENVAKYLKFMIAVRAFDARKELAQKALIDYREERYYSTVLVVLSLLDGMVNELQQCGFFSKSSSLEAWDSISAHDKGLEALKRILFKSRNKTRIEKLEIPYRNGIFHGMDLGYDNKIVAAKCWAALFATREWAIKAERGELEAPPINEEKKIQFLDLIQLAKDYQDDKFAISNWKPREIKLGIDIPETGKPIEYKVNTPERITAEFLDYWFMKNYGFMADLISKQMFPDYPIKPADISSEYKNKILLSWKITKITDVSMSFCIIDLEITYKDNGMVITKKAESRIVREDDKGTFAVRESEKSRWALVLHHLV